MLAELMVLAASRHATPPAFRRYLGGAVAYWGKAMKRQRGWAPHLAHARSLIDTGIDDFTSRRTVVVLGSGPLFEIPLESLARTFERVVLVDRAHLSATQPRLARYANIERQWRDLSPIGMPQPLGFLDDIDGLDWVISSSLLADLVEEAPRNRRREVVDSHLDALAALACPATLITEIDYRVLNRHGVMRDSADLMQGRVMPRSGLRWKWEVAPLGTDGRHTRRVNYVAAWADWREA
jgi:hypothetical protein